METFGEHGDGELSKNKLAYVVVMLFVATVLAVVFRNSPTYIHYSLAILIGFSTFIFYLMLFPSREW